MLFSFNYFVFIHVESQRYRIIQEKIIPFFDELCIQYLTKTVPLKKNIETSANVVKELDNEEEEINLEEDDFTNTNNMTGID